MTHLFTLSGLGEAPFKFIAVIENSFDMGDGTTKAGGSCAYCGTGIRWEYLLESHDHKRFVVGCDCVQKSGDETLSKVVKKERNKIAKESKSKRDSIKIDEITNDYNTALIVLENLSHPNYYFAEEGKTMRDYYEYMIYPNLSDSSKLKYMKLAIKKANEFGVI